MRIVIALVTGLVFGWGLTVSGMTSPDRVLGFLDVAGQWNPSLAFVMGGAVLSATPLFLLARRRSRPLVVEQFDCPDTSVIDRKLVAGSAIFGIGWGLSGICPGPALVALVIAPQHAAVFVVAMLAGLLVSKWTAAGKA